MKHLHLNGKRYSYTTGAIAVIKYRFLFGRSVFTDLLDNQSDNFERAIYGLCYVATDTNMNINEFLEEAKADEEFLKTAIDIVFNQILKKENNKPPVKHDDDDDKDFDEYSLIAMCACAHIPEMFYHEANIEQLSMIVRKYYEIKNPPPKTMNDKEVRRFYGIGEKQEEQIRAALKKMQEEKPTE